MVAWLLGSKIGCTTCGWYHGGMNMHGSNVSHPEDPTLGLKDTPLSKYPLIELLPRESSSYLTSNG